MLPCKLCSSKIFAEKLGRCKQCMVINALLVSVLFSLYLYVDLVQLQAVQRIALIMALAASALLMLLHLLAWCYHYYKMRR